MWCGCRTADYRSRPRFNHASSAPFRSTGSRDTIDAGFPASAVNAWRHCAADVWRYVASDLPVKPSAYQAWNKCEINAYFGICFFLFREFTLAEINTFNGPFSGTTRVSRYQKGKTNLDFTEARDSEWQWHQLGHMQVCTSLQTDNHASTRPLFFLQAGCPSCCPTYSVKALK